MRYHNCQTKYTCGVDLHSKMMYICIMDKLGETLVHQKVNNSNKKLFFKLIYPYITDLCVSAESSFSYYFLSDWCKEAGIPFFLGHALGMSHIHGSKTKNDRIDSKKIAELTIKDYLPLAHVCSQETRYLRDLVRTRGKQVQERSKLITKVKLQLYQSNLPNVGDFSIAEVTEIIESNPIDHTLKFTIEQNLSLIEFLDNQIKSLDKQIIKDLDKHHSLEYKLLSDIKGFGPIISSTILLEIDDINRFKNHKHFASYCRLVKCKHESAGKKTGSGNMKNGNAHLKYIFGQAAIQMARNDSRIKKQLDKLKNKYGDSKGITILAHKIARSVYYVIKKQEPFDMDKFLQSS